MYGYTREFLAAFLTFFAALFCIMVMAGFFLFSLLLSLLFIVLSSRSGLRRAAVGKTEILTPKVQVYTSWTRDNTMPTPNTPGPNVHVHNSRNVLTVSSTSCWPPAGPISLQ